MVASFPRQIFDSVHSQLGKIDQKLLWRMDLYIGVCDFVTLFSVLASDYDMRQNFLQIWGVYGLPYGREASDCLSSIHYVA